VQTNDCLNGAYLQNHGNSYDQWSTAEKKHSGTPAVCLLHIISTFIRYLFYIRTVMYTSHQNSHVHLTSEQSCTPHTLLCVHLHRYVNLTSKQSCTPHTLLYVHLTSEQACTPHTVLCVHLHRYVNLTSKQSCTPHTLLYVHLTSEQACTPHTLLYVHLIAMFTSRQNSHVHLHHYVHLTSKQSCPPHTLLFPKRWFDVIAHSAMNQWGSRDNRKAGVSHNI